MESLYYEAGYLVNKYYPIIIRPVVSVDGNIDNNLFLDIAGMRVLSTNK